MRATVVRYSTSRGESEAFARRCSCAMGLVATATYGATCARTSRIGLDSTLIIEGMVELRLHVTHGG